MLIFLLNISLLEQKWMLIINMKSKVKNDEVRVNTSKSL